MLDQAESLRRLVNGGDSKPNKTKIITVTSGKGGVGKSNFVVNLSIALQKKGNKVLVFDADVGMGNDDVLMGIFPKYTMFDVIKGKDISEILEEGPCGVKLLPAGSGLNQIEDLNESDRNIFLNKLEMLDGFDYIIMDTGAGINKSVLAFIACSEEFIILTTPEPTALTDAYSLAKATAHFKIKSNAKIIVNKTLTNLEGEQTFNKFKRATDKFLDLKIDYLGCIADDKKLVKGVREQVPFILLYPNCEAAKAIYNIADILLSKRNTETSMGAKGLFKKLFDLLS